MKEMPPHTFTWSRGQGSPLSRDWMTWQKGGWAWSRAPVCQSQGMESKETGSPWSTVLFACLPGCTIRCPAIASFWWRDPETAISPFNWGSWRMQCLWFVAEVIARRSRQQQLMWLDGWTFPKEAVRTRLTWDVKWIRGIKGGEIAPARAVECEADEWRSSGDSQK